MPDLPAILTVDDVAQRFQLSRDAIYRAVRRGELSPAKVCGKLRFRPDELDAWFERSRVRRASIVDIQAPLTPPQPIATRGSLRRLQATDGRGQ